MISEDNVDAMLMAIKKGSRSTSTNNATVMCNALLYLGTGEKKFLK